MNKLISLCASSMIAILFLLPQTCFAQEIIADTTPVVKSLKSINHLLGSKSDLEAVAISPTGKILAAGGWDKNIYIYSLELGDFGEIIYTFKHHTSAVISLSFDIRGQNLVCGSNDHTLSTWNIDSAINTGIQRQDLAINTVIHGPSVKYIYSCTKDGQIKMWDTKDSKRTRSINTNQKTNSFIITKDRKSIYAAGESNTITQYNLKGVKIGALDGHTAFINEVSLSPSGALLASASNDKTVIVWELLKRKQKIALIGHTAKVNSVTFSSDNKYVISGDHSGEIIIWDISTGDIVKRIPGLGNSIRDISVSRYMDYVAVASYENSGDEHVIYYCATGLLNNALDMKRKATERKIAAKEKQKKLEENYDTEEIEDILKETQEQF